MIKLHIRHLAACLPLLFLSIASFAQVKVITGNVRNSVTKEAAAAVSVTVKGSTEGTFTDEKGNFKLQVNNSFPLTVVVSGVGFSTKEVSLNSTDAGSIGLETSYAMGEEIVVAASRTPERIMESPVTIERINSIAIRNAPAANYYDAIANLKGVDLTTSSFTFRTPSTRGFNGSGNLRFNQLIDGMDNQAPGLNFAVGSIVGPTELDVESMELLSGASSALYGSGGMNGTLLINTKNPFKYQGLSAQVKTGMMHFGNATRDASPFYDVALRYAKKVS
jgi:outer membrane receptor protein involved in Fe transport